MQDIGASPGALRGCATALDQAGSELRGELRELTADVDRLLRSGWRGQAAEGFAASWARWQHGAGESLEALAAMGELLASAGTGFEGIDSASAVSVQRADGGR